MAWWPETSGKLLSSSSPSSTLPTPSLHLTPSPSQTSPTMAARVARLGRSACAASGACRQMPTSRAAGLSAAQTAFSGRRGASLLPGGCGELVPKNGGAADFSLLGVGKGLQRRGFHGSAPRLSSAQVDCPSWYTTLSSIIAKAGVF